MNIMDIKWIDVINGDGLRLSIFTSGCTIHCKGCFNKTSWDFNAGYEFTNEIKNKIFKQMNESGYYYQGISILGGEPTDNSEELIEFIKEFRKNCVDKDIWIWTGRTIQEIEKNSKYLELINLCDVAVVGPFIESLKDLSLKYRGSSNQKIIDVKTMEEII